MRMFRLNRLEDVTNISGTGIITEGIEFSNGRIVLMWLASDSLGVFDDMQAMLNVHGHNGKTVVEYV